MKVYVVTEQTTQGTKVKVFTEKKNAELYKQTVMFNTYPYITITEMETGDEALLRETKRNQYVYTYEVKSDGTFKEPTIRALTGEMARVLAFTCGDSYYNGAVYYRPLEGQYPAIFSVVVYRNQMDKADKIAHEFWERFKYDMKKKGVTLKFKVDPAPYNWGNIASTATIGRL